MALTQQQLKDLQKQLANIQTGFNTLTGSSTYNVSGGAPDLTVKPAPAPSGRVAGASDTQYVPGTTVPTRNYEQGARLGLEGEDARIAAENYGNQQMGIRYVEPKISSETARNMANALGTSGKEFEGLTQSQANAKLDQKKQALREQTSANTSSVLNPETLSGFKKQLDDMRVQLDTTKNDAWSSTQQKNDASKALVDSYSSNLASLFTPQNISQAMQNPEFQRLAEQYKSMGGDINNIAAKVTTPVVQTPETQSLDQYLGALKTPEQQKAYQTLLPENQIAQQEIAFEQSIADEYKKYYFGSPEQIGLQQQIKAQAEERIKLIERKQELDNQNMQAQKDYVIEQTNAERQKAKATTEENRLNSRNYMTGMLAKLGALNTSSAAPMAIANLDQKYQQQIQDIDARANASNREIEMKFKETMDKVDIDTENEILSIKEDLTKSDSEALKEISKLKIDANRRAFDIIGKFQNTFRSMTAKYEAETKAAAKKNAKDYMDAASTYDVSGLSFNDFINKKQVVSGPYGDIGQTFGQEKRQSLVPEFVQNLISSGSISSMLENVLQGDKSLADYSGANRTKIEQEMKRLGITRDMIGKGTTAGVSATDALKQAREAIAGGADTKAVRQRFLENFPEKSALFNSYFEE